MTDGLHHAFEPDPQDDELADRLRADRPLPGAGFRGALGRHLLENDPGYGPRRLRMASRGIDRRGWWGESPSACYRRPACSSQSASAAPGAFAATVK